MKFKVFLAIIFLLILLPYSNFARASEQESLYSATTSYHKFIIYYGWYLSHDGKLGHNVDRIISVKPEFVISPYYTSTGEINLKPEVIGKFHDNNVKVIIYLATANADRDLSSIFEETKTAFDQGADGVMLDEVSMLQTKSELDYYKKIYDYAKSFGDNKVVIANPGSILVSEQIMSVSDIVSFEHQWRLASHIEWFQKYPPTRFMGISSNDIENVMGYKVDANTAVSDTIEAWQNGIGYHFSTDSYTELAPWFEDYQKGLENYTASNAKLQDLTVKATDSNGNDLRGLWIEIKNQDRIAATGYSPAKFILPEGNYHISASDYQNYIFDRWEGQGETMKDYNIAITRPVEITAIYRNEVNDFSVESFDDTGHIIKGMHISVIKDGSMVTQGFTPLHLKLPRGQYTIEVSSYDYYQFIRWEDSSNTSSRKLDFTHDTKLIAYYDNSLAGNIGKEIFSCQDDQYKQQVAKSILDEGPLAGVLELNLKKSTMAALGCIMAA